MLLEKYSVLLPDSVVVVESREKEKKASNMGGPNTLST